ncbi:hypothetical protein CWR48_04945 [Oceanobacillus arenosus]|uniref:DUF304 domain-containing protein n=1 Tax=Oceanobacillus arenosus TaxID=1229153 RepID=A0A3D8PVL6_9BACI|nr:hypothetical protein [Oceanobacillus arenosus]RDW20074.1 hypothetical protein CWR48_04945 [Oceanobacillus arenosus]
MTYSFNGRTQKTIIFFLLIIFSQTLFDGIGPNIYYIFKIFFAMFLIATLLLHFDLTIYEDKITYQITLLNISIYKKVLSANQITQMKFTRVGWSTKGTIIKTANGLNIRVHGFSPNAVYEQLVDFANKNNINTTKTKNYQILEKMN